MTGPSKEQKGQTDIERAREAYARRAWLDAYRGFTRADATAPLDVDDLEHLAFAAMLTAHDDEGLRVWERIHQARLEASDAIGAARAAFWVGLRLSSVGEMGRASGWLGRAQRLVEEAGAECAVKGYLLIPSMWRNLAMGEWDAAASDAANAIAIGERCRDGDLVALARHFQGRTLVLRGRIAEGLPLLDEAMVAVTAGEVTPVFAGLLYCSVISCCQRVYELQRAREWTSALSSWCEGQPQLVTFAGACLVHRSEIMQLSGEWLEALDEARRASERYTRKFDRDIAGGAAYQEAEIHRLRGELAEAENAYRRASELGKDPQPGLALLRLAQDREEAAGSAIRRVMGTTQEPVQRAALLPACVEIMLATGAIDEARAACGELEVTAKRIGTDVVAAMASHARGAVLLADGDATGAVEPLRRAFEIWQKIGAPYIAARIRVLLAKAYRALGDDDATTLELDAAKRVFEKLGAAPELARVATLAKAPATSAQKHDVLTPRELEVLRLVAQGRTNKSIAKELFLSEKTVDRHVSNIFAKVNVSSRAAATAYAYQNKLV
jgi:DNA-binding NarL/FixJ family response regulator